MANLIYLSIAVIFIFASSSEEASITVVVDSDLFHSRDNTFSKGLDLIIIENFAQKIEHDVKYIVLNETLSGIFDTEEAFTEFMRFYTISTQS